MDGWILMILTQMTDIDEMLNFTQGQGHNVEGQRSTRLTFTRRKCVVFQNFIYKKTNTIEHT